MGLSINGCLDCYNCTSTKTIDIIDEFEEIDGDIKSWGRCRNCKEVFEIIISLHPINMTIREKK